MGACAEREASQQLRRDIGTIVRATLDAVDPAGCVRRFVKRQGDCLLVEGCTYDLSWFHKISVVAIGKAAVPMALAAERELRDVPLAGVVVTPPGYGSDVPGLRHIIAGHPIPDAGSASAGHSIGLIADAAGERDLVIVLLSGGASSLAVLPFPALSLADLQKTYAELLRSGADISETNTVRKYLCQVKGGRLARRAAPARVLALIISDVPGDDLSTVGSGPTCPDSHTAEDALEVLTRHGVTDRVPAAVVSLLAGGPDHLQTASAADPVFQGVQNVLVGSAALAVEAALRAATNLGYEALGAEKVIVGEARAVGAEWAEMALQFASTPRSRPLVVAGAGETSVTVKGPGLGGRNQELALSAALQVEGTYGIAVCALGTDGKDGPTDAAGAVVDGETACWIRAAGREPEEALRQNDSYNALRLSGDLLFTGPTNTNVADIVIVSVASDGNLHRGTPSRQSTI